MVKGEITDSASAPSKCRQASPVPTAMHTFCAVDQDIRAVNVCGIANSAPIGTSAPQGGADTGSRLRADHRATARNTARWSRNKPILPWLALINGQVRAGDAFSAPSGLNPPGRRLRDCVQDGAGEFCAGGTDVVAGVGDDRAGFHCGCGGGVLVEDGVAEHGTEGLK